MLIFKKVETLPSLLAYQISCFAIFAYAAKYQPFLIPFLPLPTIGLYFFYKKVFKFLHNIQFNKNIKMANLE